MAQVLPSDPARSRSLVNLRISGRDRDLIDQAAASLGKNRTEFMLDAARQAAEDALLDRAMFRLDPARFQAFQAALDAPVAPPLGLQGLLARKAPWQE